MRTIASSLCIVLSASISLTTASGAQDYERRPPPTHGSLDIPVKGNGLSIGNSLGVNGLRINFRDDDLRWVNGINLTLWQPRDNRDAIINGLALGIVSPHAGTINGLAVGVGAPVIEHEMNGLSVGVFASVANGAVNGLSVGGLASVVNGDVNGFGVGGLASVTNGGVSGMSVGGLAAVTNGRSTGLQVGGLASVTNGSMTGINVGGLATVRMTV